MRKNRLLLDQKRFLSFSNYKNYIKQSSNGNNNTRTLISSNAPSINLFLLNELKKSQNINIRNVSIFRNNSNKNNIRLLVKNKNKSKMNLSGSFIPENQSIQRNNNVFKNINKENIELVNELLKKNNFQFHINQRSSQSLDEKTFSHNKFNFRNMVTEKTFYRNNNFTNTERYSENGIVKTINKTKSENINTRKLSKESFKSDIMKRIGKKKVKYKIIGRLITEPNLKSPKKT